jgi:hypothetical protein
VDPAQRGFGRLSRRVDFEVNLLNGSVRLILSVSLLGWLGVSLEQGIGEELLSLLQGCSGFCF